MLASPTIRHLPEISYRRDVRVSYPTGIYRIFRTDAMLASPTIRHLPEISYRRDVRVSNPTGINRIFQTDRCSRLQPFGIYPKFHTDAMLASPTQPAFTGYFKQTDARVSYPTGIYRIFQTDRCSRLLPNRHLPDISHRPMFASRTSCPDILNCNLIRDASIASLRITF
jgi:hypothetical protein